MDFDDADQLDTSRVSDVRGRGGFGGGRGAAIGGGGLGLVGLLVALLLGVNPADLGGGTDGPGAGSSGDPGLTSTADLGARCQTGADADRDETCRLVAVENSLTEYWTGAVQGLQPPTTSLFEQGIRTGCGQASSAVGPFYCPADQGIYLDPGFFDELQTRFGAKGGDFAQAYVLAHEYGHHVQHVTGTDEQAQQLSAQGEQSGSVRLELQADCYAGVWAANAAGNGITFDDTDVTEGLSAAAAVGDDRIQEASAGRVDPESWTHGSAEQRQTWFRAGLSTGDPRRCDTFGVPQV